MPRSFLVKQHEKMREEELDQNRQTTSSSSQGMSSFSAFVNLLNK